MRFHARVALWALALFAAALGATAGNGHSRRRCPGPTSAPYSLSEACAHDGQREKSIAAYEKWIARNPANTNGVEQLKKLRAGSPTPAP